MQLQDILSEAERDRQLTAADRDLITRAHTFATKAHAGQKRKSGEPYIIHPEAVAMLVARWNLDPVTIAAALLHDVVEDAGVPGGDIAQKFGDDIAFLVEGVTKISQVKYRGNQAQSETLKKMILALSEDIRVVFVKLADRLHNMRTLQYVPEDKQKRIALETDEIYAPLAYRLGLASVSAELLDLAFPYLHPKEYKELSLLLKEHLATGSIYVEKVKQKLESELKKQHIQVVKIDSRAKRLSSLYKKLAKTNLENIYDLLALRIIVKNVEDCYSVLGLIHQLWPPLPGLIKDYIALPKPNGYKSIHTTVICDDHKPTEFQIRTEAMHYENEFGIAAHWAYQEAKSGKSYQENRAIFADARQAQWINQLKKWQDELQSSGSDDFIDALKIDFFKDRIFAITPKGEVVDLAAGSSPVDFAYSIHSKIGDGCAGAKVNGKIVSLEHELQSGDVVEILTQKNKVRPNEAWLGFVKTSRARSCIRSALRYQGTNLLPPTMKLTILAVDKIGLIKDITGVIAQNRVSINSISSTPSQKGELTTIKVVIEVDGKDRLDKVVGKLKRLPEVKQVVFG